MEEEDFEEEEGMQEEDGKGGGHGCGRGRGGGEEHGGGGEDLEENGIQDKESMKELRSASLLGTKRNGKGARGGERKTKWVAGNWGRWAHRQRG